MNIEISTAEYYADIDVTQDSADTAPYISKLRSVVVTIAGVDLELKEQALANKTVMDALEAEAIYRYESEGGWQQSVMNRMSSTQT